MKIVLYLSCDTLSKAIRVFFTLSYLIDQYSKIARIIWTFFPTISFSDFIHYRWLESAFQLFKLVINFL